MRKVRLKLQYDGTNYSGWQVQPDRVTIQGLVEACLRRMTGEETRVSAAGRTDAGVHALEQVASFTTSSAHTPQVFQKALNGMLPEDIRILSSDYADDDFHPRYSAKAKSYFYLIDCSEIRNPFLGRYSYHLNHRLDTEGMVKASSFLVGRDDFSSFRASGCGAKTTVREIYSMEIEQMNSIEFLTVGFSGSFIKVSIKANAFMRHMARNIIGTLIEVGRDRMRPEMIRDIIEARDRTIAGPSVPARGLFLKRVYYQ